MFGLFTYSYVRRHTNTHEAVAPNKMVWASSGWIVRFLPRSLVVDVSKFEICEEIYRQGTKIRQ